MKTGFCHITPDKIYLTNSQEFNETDLIKVESSSTLQKLAYATLGFMFLMYYILLFSNENYIMGSFFLLISVIFFFSLWKGYTITLEPVINRADIQEIKFNKELPLFASPQIVIHFKKNGKILKNILVLPNNPDPMSKKLPEAIEILKKEGLY